jgi:hypothetical protein
MGERKNGDAVEGYVKLWRKSMESAVFKNANVWKFWCWCLMKATHKPVQILVGYQRVDLVPGQFIFGRAKASKELRLSEREIRTCVDTLSKLENMTIKATNKFSIISICNWDTYQNGKNENDQHNDQQATNKRPTSDHKQEYKECKEEKTSSPGNNGDGYSEDFKIFWKAYPRRAGKGKAFAQWKKVAKDSQVRKEIMKAIPLQIKSGVLRTDDLQYCPHPATWLNQRRWEDEIPEISKTAQKGFDNVPDAI